MEVIRNRLNPTLVEYKLRSYVKQLGDLSYNECVELAQYSESNLEALSPFDPATPFFIQQRISAYQFAELLNAKHGLERDDHAEPINVIYTLGGDVYEGRVYLPRYYRLKTTNPAAEHQLRTMVIEHHNWQTQNLTKFDLTVE